MHRRHRKSAFTLVELMVVIIIAAIIMAIGVGVYQKMNRDLAWHAEVTAVTSLLHAARNAAITNRTPVSVVFECEPADDPDLEAGGFRHVTRSYATFWRRVGSWSFEPENESGGILTGAMAQKATVHGQPEPVSGKFGKGIAFRQWDDENHDYMECERISAYDIREGIRISAWVKPEPPPGADEAPPDTEFYYPIASKGSYSDEGEPSDPAYSLLLKWKNGRMFQLVGEVKSAPSGGLVTSESPPVIRPNVWTHVSMIFLPGRSSEAAGIKLLINDEELTDDTETTNDPLISVATEPLLIGGDGTYYFVGAIDELTIDAAVTSENSRKPHGNVVFRFEPDGSGVFRLNFDRRGRLDSDDLPLIVVKSTGTNSATFIGVERTGAVRTWQAGGESIEQQKDEWFED